MAKSKQQNVAHSVRSVCWGRIICTLLLFCLQFTSYLPNKTRVMHVHSSCSQMSVAYGGEFNRFFCSKFIYATRNKNFPVEAALACVQQVKGLSEKLFNLEHWNLFGQWDGPTDLQVDLVMANILFGRWRYWNCVKNENSSFVPFGIKRHYKLGYTKHCDIQQSIAIRQYCNLPSSSCWPHSCDQVWRSAWRVRHSTPTDRTASICRCPDGRL
jgi:hypothetical protein